MTHARQHPEEYPNAARSFTNEQLETIEKMKSEIGYMEGELCNRNGCEGVLEEGERDGDGCSCHIAPPCHYCCQNVAYCPVCEWDAKDEKQP